MRWRWSSRCPLESEGGFRAAARHDERVRNVIRNFNADGFSSLYPKYKGGRPPKFTLALRREVKKTARSHPDDHGLPFSTWSPSKLAEFLVAEGVVDDISHEGLRILLREESVTFQRLQNLAGARGGGCAPLTTAPRGSGTCSRPTSWARISCSGTSSRAREEPGSWSSAATCVLSTRPGVRIAVICHNFSRTSPLRDSRVGDRAAASNVEIAYTPSNASWLNRSPVHSPALLRTRRHRPRHPQRTGQHDPPVHHLAQQPRLRRTTPPHRQPRKRGLTRHQESRV